MTGITITEIKIVGICSKCRKEGDEVLKDKNGKPYSDKEIACASCALIDLILNKNQGMNY